MNYGNFKNFISDNERLDLLNWAKDNRHHATVPNGTFGFRVREINKLPNNSLALIIGERIKEHFDIECILSEWHCLSFMYDKGYLENHLDDWANGRYRKFILIIQKPTYGGNPIYDGNKLDWSEKELFEYRPDLYFHGTVPSEGDLERIVLVYGWGDNE